MSPTSRHRANHPHRGHREADSFLIEGNIQDITGRDCLHRTTSQPQNTPNFTDVSVSSIQGEYLSEGAAREWSTVVKIFIPPPSFKPVTLSLPRSPLFKTPKQVFF